MKKLRFITMLLIIGLVFTTICGNFTALTTADQTVDLSSPRMAYITDIRPDLTLASSIATLQCDVIGIPVTTTKITVTGTLQRYVSGVWINVSSTSQTANSYRMKYSRTAAISSGYSYRAMYEVKAYSGTNFETVRVYSNTVVAP